MSFLTVAALLTNLQEGFTLNILAPGQESVFERDLATESGLVETASDGLVRLKNNYCTVTCRQPSIFPTGDGNLVTCADVKLEYSPQKGPLVSAQRQMLSMLEQQPGATLRHSLALPQVVAFIAWGTATAQCLPVFRFCSCSDHCSFLRCSSSPPLISFVLDGRFAAAVGPNSNYTIFLLPPEQTVPDDTAPTPLKDCRIHSRHRSPLPAGATSALFCSLFSSQTQVDGRLLVVSLVKEAMVNLGPPLPVQFKDRMYVL